MSEQLVPVSKKISLEEFGAYVQVPLTFEEAEDANAKLAKVLKRAPYWVGDTLNAIEAALGERASQLIDAEHWHEPTIKGYRWVCERVPPENRKVSPSFAHCQAVAALPVDTQREWLIKAATGTDGTTWTVAKLKHELLKAMANGNSKLCFWLVVQCSSEAKQTTLSAQLERDGFTVKAMSGIKRVKKPKRLKAAPKARRAKPGPVTARGRRRPKMSATRRQPV